jgi:hypothetical protein
MNLEYYLENRLVTSMFAINQLFSWFVGAYAHDKFIKNVDTLFSKSNRNHYHYSSSKSP